MDLCRGLVLAFVDATCFGGKEASIYGTATGLRLLAAGFRNSVANRSESTLFDTAPNGLLVETGVQIILHWTDDLVRVASDSFSNTLRFRRLKRRYFREDTLEYSTRRASKCKPREDGGFAVAYPVLAPVYSLVIAGNSTGILHIADHIDGMAGIEFGTYNPNWPEPSEHYHSWIDGEDDVMLDCGLGLQYGRLDHRKDGSVGWMLENRVSNRDQLEMLVKGDAENRV